MIVGLSPKPGDMIINVMKGKKLTNMRTQGTDENVVLTPVRKMSIAEQLSMLNTDEALEITPESCRLRKAILDPHERKKSEKSGAAAQLKVLLTKNKPKATQDPIPNAKIRVPTPTVPPRYQPANTAEISKRALTKAIGRFVSFVSPVINPSLGPGPRFATR